MGKKKGEALQPEVTEQGIKVFLGKEFPGEYIVFRKDGWSWPDRVKWSRAGAVEAMEMLIGWAVDWKLKDQAENWIAFDRDALLENVEGIVISMPKASAMAGAVYAAFNQASVLPLA